MDQKSAVTFKLFPIWLSLIGAFVEVLVLYIEKRRDPLMLLSGDFAWMAPLALLTVVVSVVALLAVVARMWRHPVVAWVSVFAPAALVALNLLILVPGMAHYAAALLATGIAVQVTRAVIARPEAVARLMKRSAVPIVVAFLVFGGFQWITSPVPQFPGSSVVQPNVLLVTLDTVRAANMSVYGYTRQTTPQIERYSRQGVVFAEAHSTAPWTLPSHASMFTGRWPHELPADHDTPLDGAFPTLAEYLRDRGYATAGFVANLKYVGAGTGLNRGFGRYEDYSPSIGEIASTSTLVRTIADNFRLRRLIENDEHLNRITADELNSRALGWMGAQTGASFFAFMNYFDAHEPYLPPPPFDRQFGPGRAHGRHSPLHHWLWNPAVRHRPFEDAERQEEIDAYDGSLAHLDAAVGRLLDRLDQLGILANTLVVITSDHGEEFGEHGVYEHGYSLYRPSVHVPLIVIPPRSAGTRRAAGADVAPASISTPVSLRDLAATIVDLAGLGDGAPFPGSSLAGLWRDTSATMTSPLLTTVTPSPGQPDWFPSSKGDMQALVHEGLRYIRNGDGREELYDFAADRWERTNLAALPERQQALAGARAALDRLMAGRK
jgi:arylsulfatase A-like enzyme